MIYPTLLTGGLSLLLLTAGDLAANPTEIGAPASLSVPVVDAAELSCVDASTNPFPTSAMAEEFADYLRWTKANGLSRLAAFEALVEGRSVDDVHLPSERMREQFTAYLRWTEAEGLSPYYAIRVTNFD